MMFKLSRHFSLCSAVITMLMTAGLVYGYRTAEIAQLVAWTERENISLSRALANSMFNEIQAYVDEVGGTDPDVIRASPESAAWYDKFRHVVAGLPILKIKIYTIGGKTVFSSESAQIGKGPSHGVEFQTVLHSSNTHSKLEFRKSFVAFEGIVANRYLVGTYVPVLDRFRRVTAVLELYTDVTHQVEAVSDRIWIAATVLSAAFGLFYLALFLIVRRADLIIRRQYQAVSMFNSTLEARVAARTVEAQRAVTAANHANDQLRGEIEERKRAELAMVRKGQRLTVLLDSLSLLMRGEILRQDSINDVFSTLTEIAASTMGVARVSIWLFDQEHRSILCTDLFERASGKHSAGYKIEVREFPRYFQTLSLGGEIVADDAATHPSTGEFVERYLKPKRIASMLDVPVLRNGKVEGIVSCEEVGDPISWSAEQRLFALSIAGLVAMLLERHERVRAELGLREANSSLEAATAAKSQFLANMSHEIRTPMNGVFGMTELLLRTKLTDRQHRLVSTISQSAENLLTVINDILDLSRIEAGKLVIENADLDLRECVEAAVDLFVESATRKGLGLSLFVAPDVPAVLRGDTGRLRQVCVNLIGNSIKFTNRGEVAIRVTTGVASGEQIPLKLQFRDTGIGIDPAVKEKLCAPFVQADSSITRRFGGTGLGLSISRHLVGLMGGTFDIDSEPGKGTTITIELPLAPGSSDVSEASAPKVDLAGRRVLVVDDRGTDLEIMMSYLSAAGAEVVTAESVDTGLNMLRAAVADDRPIDVAVVDMVLPGGSGLDLLRAVSTDPCLSGLRTIVVTSLSCAGDVGEMRRHGASALLTKPVHQRELVAVVAQTIGGCDALGREQDQAQSPRFMAGNSVSCSVLLAEDNPVNIEVAKEHLGALGCTVTVAETGREAVAACERKGFDIILMDCQMPDMDGITATRHLREREARLGLTRTPIIAVTANAFEEDRKRCIAAGMDDYLAKPYSESDLVAVLRRWRFKWSASVEGSAPEAAAEQGLRGVVSQMGTGTGSGSADAPVGVRQSGAAAGAASTNAKVSGRQSPGANAPKRKAAPSIDIAKQLLAAVHLAARAEDADALKLAIRALRTAGLQSGQEQLVAVCEQIERAAVRGGPAGCLPMIRGLEQLMAQNQATPRTRRRGAG